MNALRVFTFLPCWALALAALTVSLSHAGTPGLPFTEDFSTTDLRDDALTNANWSTEEQAVFLAWAEQRQLPRYSANGMAVGSETDLQAWCWAMSTATATST